MTRKKKRRLLLAAGALLLTCILAFFAYLLRQGHDYAGDFAALLPADTAAFCSLRDLEGTIRKAEASPDFTSMLQGGALEELLLSSRKMRKLDRKITQLEVRSRMTLGRDFLERWFGEEACFAVLPSTVNRPFPGLLAMSRTRIGFEENLAEFVARHYPGLSLETINYRNERISRYIGKEEKRCFSYMRFGRTVFLSLRTSDTTILKELADRKLDVKNSNLAGQKDFRDWRASLGRKDGLSFLVRNEGIQELIGTDNTFMSSVLFKDRLTGSPKISGTMYFDRGIMAQIRIREPFSEPDRGNKTHMKHMSLASRRTVGFLNLRSSILAEMLMDIAATQSEDGDEFVTVLHNYIAKSLGDIFGDEVFLDIRTIRPGIFMPMIEGGLICDFHSRKAADGEIQRWIAAFGTDTEEGSRHAIPSPLGLINYRWKEETLMASIHPDGAEYQPAEVHDRLISTPEFQEASPEGLEKADLVLYLNPLGMHQGLEEAYGMSLAWPKDVKRHVRDGILWAEVLSPFRCIILESGYNGGETHIRLYAPLE